MIDEKEIKTNFVYEEASRWLAREQSSTMTNQEKSDLESWLASDPQHQEVYLETYKASNLIDELSGIANSDNNEILDSTFQNLLNSCPRNNKSIENKQNIFSKTRGLGLIAASIMLFITFSILFQPNGPIAHIHKSGIGEMDTIMLNDGTVITLNTDTEISVAMSPDERKVLLVHGEAYFDVAKDTKRPFSVIIGKDVVRAVGTSFNIKHRTEVTRVTVTEGVVEVKSNPISSTSLNLLSFASPISLGVGANLTINGDTAQTNLLSSLELEQSVAWRTGMLHFNGEPLSAIVDELQYYAHKEIILASNQVSDLIVGGSFNVNNVSSFLKGLELTFPIKVIERENVIIISYAKKDDDIVKAMLSNINNF